MKIRVQRMDGGIETLDFTVNTDYHVVEKDDFNCLIGGGTIHVFTVDGEFDCSKPALAVMEDNPCEPDAA